MREFLWGMALGALLVLFYDRYGDDLQNFRRYTLSWREWAVHETKGFGVGHEQKK